MSLTRFDATWQGWRMRFPVRVLTVSAWLLAACGLAASAQTPPASPGSAQVPAGAPRDQPARRPLAVPRTPAEKGGAVAAPKVPVVPPHGPVHPHKPPAKAKTTPVRPPPPPVAQDSDAAAAPKTAQLEQLTDPEKPEGAPARLPRFASLRSDDVNLRAGPGKRYRIEWVYKRRDLPVEIEREFDVWRWVRDPDGIQGWVHQATLTGRRNFIVGKVEAMLRADASDTAAAVAILKPGVIGRIRSCPASSDWCNVQTGSYRGYLHRTAFWGLLPGEIINP
jgi:SH3-like domain-containing protein